MFAEIEKLTAALTAARARTYVITAHPDLQVPGSPVIVDAAGEFRTAYGATGGSGYLVKPFKEADLLPAISTARARHDELTALREEAQSLTEALAARKAIERAKGLLMEREGLTEQDAFARLRKASQISGRPLKVVAEALIATLDSTTR